MSATGSGRQTPGRWRRVGEAVLLTQHDGQVGWSWEIRRDGGDSREVRVAVIGAPFRVTDLPAEARNAIRSRGATAVDMFQFVEEPPELIEVSIQGVHSATPP